MAKILIPTALRQFTDQKDSVEVERRHGRRSAEAADGAVSRPEEESVQRRRASCAASSTSTSTTKTSAIWIRSNTELEGG